MDTHSPNTIPPDTREPSQPPHRWRLRRFFLALVVVMIAFVAIALFVGPEFHRSRVPVGGPLDGRDPAAAAVVAQQDARRLLTECSALHAATKRAGRWDAVITEREINAWLAIDLPRNHAAVAGGWGTDARIDLRPGRVRAGCRVGSGPLSIVAWIEADVRLRSTNQLGIVITDARLGSLPVPRGPILKAIGRRLDALGVATEVRRFDDHAVLLVYIPSTTEPRGSSRWLEAFMVAEDELAFSGETRQGSPIP